jgi:NAD(P)-dependent dehydrogenase (short-subunit alcohol dehydrogenase family)
MEDMPVVPNEKVVIVTGANGGLGNSVTRAFLGSGARVAGVSRAIADSEFPSPNFHAISADLNAETAIQISSEVENKWGRIDVLIHLVGAFAGGQSVAETTDETMDRMFDTNFRSAFYMVRAVLPRMRAQGGGRIVAIGSRPAIDPVATLGAYAASKAALVSLIRTVALENKDIGITANVVLPGTMDTPANRAAMPAADPAKWVQPANVATLLLYLASDQAAQVNGAAIPMYGADL